uniref:Uncharacterized protein n=1 Tax=Arundo donax TaxID=35708 RepID=A0A0A9CUB1_ARUDO
MTCPALQRDHHHHQPLLQMHQSHMLDPHLQSSRNGHRTQGAYQDPLLLPRLSDGL